MSVLKDELQSQIDLLIDSAYEDFQNGNFEESYNKQLKAWDLFPDPKNKWNEGYNVAKYIFEDKFSLKEYDVAKQWLDEMVLNNDNLNKSDGECEFYEGKYYFEIGNYGKSIEKFRYVVSKYNFRYFEDEDPKYLDFYKNPDKYIKS